MGVLQVEHLGWRELCSAQTVHLNHRKHQSIRSALDLGALLQEEMYLVNGVAIKNLVPVHESRPSIGVTLALTM